MRWSRARVSRPTPIMNKGDSIFVAGHRGLVGSAIVRRLNAEGYDNLLLRTRADLDLRDQAKVENFFAEHRPAYVFLAAGLVGGIHANDTYPADFIRDNLLIETNVIDAAFRHGTRKLQFLGSSCIYPKFAPQPIPESSLLTGALEPTNEAYAIAKIAGVKMCEAYRRQHNFNAISLMPSNLYGPGDNFDLQNSHVLPALIRKFHDAKVNRDPDVVVWGTGTPRREFLFVDDLADACLFLMSRYEGEGGLLNVGYGTDVTILELAQTIREVTGFEGELRFDTSRPDGTPRKLLATDRAKLLGWSPKTGLREGIEKTYAWFVDNHVSRSS
jgi:GDP-L-fucose synthase